MYVKIGMIPLASIFAIAISCSSIQSIKTGAPIDKIDNLFVLIDPGVNFIKFGEKVKSELEENLLLNNVKTEIIVPTGLELEDDINKKIENYKYFLKISLTAGTVDNSFGLQTQISGTYDLSIYDVSTKKRIWRAIVKLGSMGYGMGPQMLVEKTINALAKDGFINNPPKLKKHI